MKLNLPIKAKWFWMIYDGIKETEYRALTPYYVSRLFNYKKSGLTREEFLDQIVLDKTSELWGYIKKFDQLGLTNGYTPKRDPIMTNELIHIDIGPGKKEWGAEGFTNYFRIHLGRKINEFNIPKNRKL